MVCHPKVDATEHNDVTKHHSTVVTLWRTSVIGVTALSKTHFQKWKVCKKKNLSWVWGTDRKIYPRGSQSDITWQAKWCQTVIPRRQIFLSTPHIQILIIYTDGKYCTFSQLTHHIYPKYLDTLTHLCRMDSSILTHWTSPFPIEALHERMLTEPKKNKKKLVIIIIIIRQHIRLGFGRQKWYPDNITSGQNPLCSFLHRWTKSLHVFYKVDIIPFETFYRMDIIPLVIFTMWTKCPP